MNPKPSKRQILADNRKRIHAQLRADIAAEREIILPVDDFEGLEPIHPHHQQLPDHLVTAIPDGDLLNRIDKRRARSATWRQTGDLN
jgi:hypothetical protein